MPAAKSTGCDPGENNPMPPIRVAITGVGGFARDHIRAISNLATEGVCTLVAVCDPSFSGKPLVPGVLSFSSLEEMLATGGFDVVTLPTPIPLHAPMHRAVVEAGKACYLEKPPTLSLSEYEEMLRVEAGAVVKTQVGFNFVGEPMRRRIKKRILEGEFGSLESASFLGIWPRDRNYYARANWAGRLSVDGRPVFDNPIGNATAHYTENLLFWAGEDLDSVGRIQRVAASLYRAHAIESFDTGMIEAELENGIRLRYAVTHAATDRHRERETVHLEKAKIVFDHWRMAHILHGDGGEEVCKSPISDGLAMLEQNLRYYFAYVRGEELRPTTSLEDCESFVSLIDLAFSSAGNIQTFDHDRIEAVDHGLRVEGLVDELQNFIEAGFGVPPRWSSRR